MNKKKLQSLRKELTAIRRSPQNRSAADLKAIAKKVGRVLDKRGKEPTWVRKKDPALSPPLSIPDHGNVDLKCGTVRSIVDQLLNDLDEWDMHLADAEEDDDDESNEENSDQK